MKLYLDTADVEQWLAPPGCPSLQGVTTNPTLIRQAGLPVSLPAYLHLIAQAGQRRLPELMLQLPGSAVAEVRAWLGELVPAAALARLRLTIKLPCHPDWAQALHEVRDWGVQCLLTGLSNPLQLLWARAQGADFVAPYLGRLESEGRDVWSLVEACVALQGDGVKLLAASIKKPETFARLIAAGAYAATLKPEFVGEWTTDPLTEAAIAQFETDTVNSREFPLPHGLP